MLIETTKCFKCENDGNHMNHNHPLSTIKTPNEGWILFMLQLYFLHRVTCSDRSAAVSFCRKKLVCLLFLCRSFSSLLFPHSAPPSIPPPPDSETSLCTLCWVQTCTVPGTLVFSLSSFFLFFPICPVCLFSFVLADPFEHFQVQPRPSKTQRWDSGACCLATGSKACLCVAAAAVVVLCNSGFDGRM